MRNTTGSERHSRSRKTRPGVAMRLAVMLAVLLLGVQQAGEAQAGSPAMQLSARTAHPPGASQQVILRVGTSPDYWPMEYFSGSEIVGYGIDLMDSIAARMGVTVVYIGMPWEGIFQGLLAGDYDAIMSSVSVYPDRDEIMDFTLPYITIMGNDNLAVVVQQGNDLLRRQINEALWQLRVDGTLGTIVAEVAADKPEWEPRLPDWPYIPPDSASTQVYSDAQQSSTVIQVPSGAVTETILLTYVANTAMAPSGFAFADHAFKLEAYQNGIFAPGFAFNAPVTMTIHYTETDLNGMDETTLRLDYWDDATGKWEDAATTCTPQSEYNRRPDENWLAVAICHLSEFALFGQHRIHLPLVLRN